MLRGLLAGLAICGASAASAQNAQLSPDFGARIAVIGGCHDCHTAGYGQANGQVDPATALKGSPVGYQGPWGTTYAANLLITASKQTEDEWVDYLKTFTARPPMPWYNVHAFTEDESRSLYQYIVSLGDPGDPAPEYVPPGDPVKTPYSVFAPPIMPNGM